MSNNPANQPIEDQFLRWHQEMEAKQEKQARKMAELREHANRFQQENERLRTRLDINRGDNSKGIVYPAPPAHPNKGKEPILMGESDPPVDDELSSGSSLLLARLPPQNNLDAESTKKSGYPTDLSVARAAGYEERLVETDAIQNWPPNICLSSPGVWLLSFHPCIIHSG